MIDFCEKSRFNEMICYRAEWNIKKSGEAVSCISGISYKQYLVYYKGEGILYTINNFVYWGHPPFYKFVYSIQDTNPVISIRDTAYTTYL